MRSAFREQLDVIGDELAEMSRLSSIAMRQAVRALETGDGGLAESVIASDTEIDNLRDGLEIRSFDLLALQAPVATDLRAIVASLRMVFDLERMGDLAVHVAKVARLRRPNPVLPGPLMAQIAEMGRTAAAIGDRAADMIRTRDVSAVSELEKADDELDRMHRSLFQVLARDDDSVSNEATVDAVLLSRYCERFGDHAVSLGERIVFLVTGQFPPRHVVDPI